MVHSAMLIYAGILKYSTHPFVELVVLDDFIKDFSNVDPRTIS